MLTFEQAYAGAVGAAHDGYLVAFLAGDEGLLAITVPPEVHGLYSRPLDDRTIWQIATILALRDKAEE